jgi:hypothetical protein
MFTKPRTVVYKGLKMPLNDAIKASKSVLSPGTVWSRLDAGWPVERAAVALETDLAGG